MENHILVSEIAQRIGATSNDTASLAPVWQGMMRQDDNGRLWVSTDKQGYILGALDAAADCRKDQRVNDADASLTSSYKALTTSDRRGAPGIHGAARHQTQMLKSVCQVLDAITELVDAKVDARRMRAETAAEIRADVDRLRRDAEQNAARAVRAIRALLALTV